MTLLAGADLRALFHEFEHTAFRLETREQYYEREQLAQFLAGQQVDLSYMTSWLELMRRSRAQGKRIERVRIVSWPPSDYTRYGLWLAQYNTEAGEDIRYVPRDRAAGLPEVDYWLLDSCRLYRLRFAEDDGLLGAEQVTDPAAIVQAGAWRDAAWHHAIPYRDFVKGIRVD
jgi:hypothetical protein